MYKREYNKNLYMKMKTIAYSEFKQNKRKIKEIISVLA